MKILKNITISFLVLIIGVTIFSCRSTALVFTMGGSEWRNTTAVTKHTVTFKFGLSSKEGTFTDDDGAGNKNIKDFTYTWNNETDAGVITFVADSSKKYNFKLAKDKKSITVENWSLMGENTFYIVN